MPLIFKCPFCKEEVKFSKFTDELSFKEFEISGLCQECQDKAFEFVEVPKGSTGLKLDELVYRSK